MRAHFYVRNRDLAEEIATETFVRVYDAMTRGLGPHFTFRGYYLAAIHNAVAQRSRSAAVRTEMATGQVEIYAPPVYDNDECVRTESVRAVLAAMPKRWSTALQLSGIEGQSPQQLGSVLGLSPSAAAALTYRARNAFRRAYLTLDAERRKELG